MAVMPKMEIIVSTAEGAEVDLAAVVMELVTRIVEGTYTEKAASEHTAAVKLSNTRLKKHQRNGVLCITRDPDDGQIIIEVRSRTGM